MYRFGKVSIAKIWFMLFFSTQQQGGLQKCDIGMGLSGPETRRLGLSSRIAWIGIRNPNFAIVTFKVNYCFFWIAKVTLECQYTIFWGPK